jgi:hypothetical protein
VQSIRHVRASAAVNHPPVVRRVWSNARARCQGAQGIMLAGLLLMLCAGCMVGQVPDWADSAARDPAAAQPGGASPESLNPPPDEIKGIVVDESGPVSFAVVRVQATDRWVQADENGNFVLSLDGLDPDTVNLTAWAEEYFCGGPVQAMPGAGQVLIELQAHSDQDNPEYAWLPSTLMAGQGEDQGCAACHSRAGSDLDILLPVDEWLRDAHSQTASNPRFLSMYYGTNLAGEQSPPTRFANTRDYGALPIPPDPDQPYFGPGYKLDFPQSAGNCGACHLPAAAANNAYGVDPITVSGVEAEGIPCDFCHKVWDIRLDPATGLPQDNMPGVLSLSFRRPFEGHQFFAGPYDDVAPGEDTYSQLQTESAFCAACHYGVFWDTVIYNSFGEWLESPYSDPVSGQTCQDCHMPHSGANRFVLESAGGLERDPEQIFSHRMLGVRDEDFLRGGLTFDASVSQTEAQISVDVTIINENTGHNFPTDSPLRQLLLIVKAQDSSGSALEQLDGPQLPDWAGEGRPSNGYFGGLPGKGYALILEEQWTGISPTGAYWKPVRMLEDTRLKPFQADRAQFIFRSPDNGAAMVEVSLVFRRAFIELADLKSWEQEDLILYRQNFMLAP